MGVAAELFTDVDIMRALFIADDLAVDTPMSD